MHDNMQNLLVITRLLLGFKASLISFVCMLSYFKYIFIILCKLYQKSQNPSLKVLLCANYEFKVSNV